MAYATDILKLKAIFAIIVSNNKTSIKLLEKIGMKFIKLFCFANDNEELMLYRNQKK